MADESLSEDFRVDVGRANNGRTFLRVVHLPSGRNKQIVGLCGRTARDVADELARRLLQEINDADCRSD